MNVKSLTLAATLLFTMSAVAQTAPPPGTAGKRKADQQARIAQGVKSGQLTAHETGNLEHREASVNKEERNMRAANGGKLTAADRAAINNRQNKISGSIYKDKHTLLCSSEWNGWPIQAVLWPEWGTSCYGWVPVT